METLLLRAALLDGERARDAWRDWRRSRELEEMDTSSWRLAPLLYRNLLAYEIDDPELARLKEVYLRSWRHNQRLFHRGGEVLGALAVAGLQTMVLKGAALSTLYYRDTGARPMLDFDVLVHTAEATTALDVLERAGWRLTAGLSRRQLLATRHSMALVAPDGLSVDLHWRALDQPARDDDFWDGAERLQLGDRTTLAPGPAEQLLHLCAHGLGASPAGLRWVADSVMVVRRPEVNVDWDRLVERAIARRLTLSVSPALRYLHASFGVRVPEDAMVRLEEAPTTAAERLVHRAAWGRRSRTAFAAETWDRYRRLRTAEHDSPVPDGFLSFLADYLGHASRGRMLVHAARRALSRTRRP